VFNDYSQDFVKQAVCKEKALNQIAQGSTVEFQVAGQCGLGVLDAAKEKKVFGIGVDADQGYLGTQVMTSALKKVDVAVYSAINKAKAGKLAGGKNTIFDAKVNGVGYGKWSPKVSGAIKTAVAAQFRLLKAGKIKGIPATVK
jgi:basic membrane protein A